MKFNDAALGAFFILFGALLFVLTHGMPAMPGQHYGPDLFPRVIGSLLAIAGVVLVSRGLRARRTGAPWATALEWMQSPGAVNNFVLMIAVLVFYILASHSLGFLITGFVSLLVLMLRLRGVSTAVSSIAISLACVLVMQMFFGQMLRVPLPWGVLQDYAW